MLEFHITVNQDHQAILPQAFCDTLGAKPGDEIVMLGTPHDMRVYRNPDIAKRMTALRELQRIAREVSPPDVSWSDELIAERREEAAREEAEIQQALKSDKREGS